MGLALAVIVSLGSGYFLSMIFWPRRPSSALEFLFCIFLSTGLAAGLSSIVLIFDRALGLGRLLALDASLFGILALAYVITSPGKSIRTLPPVSTDQKARNWLDRALVTSCAFVTLAALYTSVLRCMVHPHGEGWDAFSIWNLHARFLFRGGAAWRDGFTSIIPWSHPDYPLLLPGAIAHFWLHLGHESQGVPAIIGLVFTFGTAGLLFSSLGIVRGCRSALLGTMALLSTPFFVEQGTSEYADVPLSFFYLAAISLLSVNDHFSAASPTARSKSLIALAGSAAGFAAWTKNEGLLFLLAFAIAQIVTAARSKAANHEARGRLEDWTGAVPMFFGMLPVLLVIVWFKHFVAPPGDLFPDRAAALQKLADASRYKITFSWFWKEFFRFGDWLLFPATVVIPILYIPAKSHQTRSRSGFQSAIIAIGLTLAGYFAIYLITPHDLYWHLRNSLGRLFLQVWPSAVFMFFSALPAEAKYCAPSQPASK
jgi:hypothetical protein